MKRAYEEVERDVDGGRGQTSSPTESPGLQTRTTGGGGKTVFGTKDFTEEEHASMQRLLEKKIPVEFLSTRIGSGRSLL